ncbi:hypothetical protein HYH03_012590 [Edaphochlamys debaryana]|uniref:Uncharacterized protein n=1 Tax=Edaphochlamys debaryana TaxID=47281 RepID=A0A835XSC5_9CHLO|nr:hypothetical protein HYH03_012590 [Edaphochlamys debaryana]|eukprot:KAG2488790.1 hypothetical protein HYH03_012590 [Edaphochlamys debaryana]
MPLAVLQSWQGVHDLRVGPFQPLERQLRNITEAKITQMVLNAQTEVGANGQRRPQRPAAAAAAAAEEQEARPAEAAAGSWIVVGQRGPAAGDRAAARRRS